MRAIILAAGRGSRMKDMTDERPKCLVEVRGKPLLEWQLTALRSAGCEEIAIVTGYRHELLQGYGLLEFHNARWMETNMVSSLECAESWLLMEPCIVSYADIFYGADAVVSLIESSADLAVTYDANWLNLWSKRFGDPLMDAETFRMTDSGKLVEIGNKPRSVSEVQGQYMGLLRFTPRAWKEISRIRATLEPQIRDKMHMTGTLQKIIDAGVIAVHGVSYGGDWGEVDCVDDLAIYQK